MASQCSTRALGIETVSQFLVQGKATTQDNGTFQACAESLRCSSETKELDFVDQIIWLSIVLAASATEAATGF